ncbi:MAG: hypothetical protein ACR2RA_00810 [Geminicoccaceae bacterium]
MNGSVEHLGQSHDHLRRSQNIMAWTTAIFGALLLSGLVWIANDIFHLKDQLMETDRRFDDMGSQMTAIGTRMDDLNIAIEQLGAELLAARNGRATITGPDVSVLSTPTTPESFQTAANAPLETTAPDAAAQPQASAQAQVPTQQALVQQQQQIAQPQQQAALAPAQPQAAAQPAVAAATPAAPIPAIAPSPPAPRDQLTPEEQAAPAPVLAAVAPAAAPAQAPAAPAAEGQPAQAEPAATQVAAAPAAEAAPAPAPAAAPLADLSDDQLLFFNDDQIDPADELLLLDENGNPQ